MVKIPAENSGKGAKPQEHSGGEHGGEHSEKKDAKPVKTFYIDMFEVTQAEYQRVMGSNPSHFRGMNLPVETVYWRHAVKYCRKVGKRLPTDLEWEKAAKGGKEVIFPWGDDPKVAGEYAWYEKNSGGKSHSVGQKKPNGYGLYDMAGNVQEWTANTADSSSINLRGGSWFSDETSLKTANKPKIFPLPRSDTHGFRCASNTPP